MDRPLMRRGGASAAAAMPIAQQPSRVVTTSPSGGGVGAVNVASTAAADRDYGFFRFGGGGGGGGAAAAPQPQEAVSEGNERSTSPYAYSSPFSSTEADATSVAETSHYEASALADNWCHTEMCTVKFNYMWTINNFSISHEEVSEAIKSSTFGSSPNDKLRWCLRINPKGLDEESRDHLSIYLLLVQCNRPDVYAKFKFSILNGDREEIKAMESQRSYRFVQGKDWGFKKFVKREQLLDEASGFLPDGKLCIYCEVFIVNDPVNVTGQNTLFQVAIPPCTIAEDFGTLFGDETFTDCTVKVDKVQIRAHRAVLAARSAVFKAMFTHATAERESQSVTITDLDEETVRGMLQFIYSGNVPDLGKLAYKLLAAADKYALPRLKIMCERSLCMSLNSQNVCEIFVHADMHAADQLRSRCISFINLNAATVMESEQWPAFVQDYGVLLSEVYRSMVTHQLPIWCGTVRKRARHY